jgi:hypothetical protein
MFIGDRNRKPATFFGLEQHRLDVGEQKAGCGNRDGAVLLGDLGAAGSVGIGDEDLGAGPAE